jgi:hypothetical protein
MRCIKATCWSAVAACALALAVASGPAMAGQFTASRMPKPLSEAEPGKTKGVGVGSTTLGGEERNQELRFGVFHIFCAAKTSAKTVAEGAIPWATSLVFATEVKFEKCLTKTGFEGFIGGTKTRFNVNPETNKVEPVKFVYHVNGVVELGTGEVESEVEVGSGSASFSILGKICKINWPRQTVPAKAVKKPEEEFSAAAYSTKEVPVEEKFFKKFPSGFQKRLVIANEFKGMEWHYEEGQCVGEGGFEEGVKKEEGKSATYKGSLEEELIGGNLGFETGGAV